MKHIMFAFVDHYEPDSVENVLQWRDGLRKLSNLYRDREGNPPKHTWFYHGEDEAILHALSECSIEGLGEIEMHLHHGNDTEKSLADLIDKRLTLYNKFGACITQKGERKFGFIHGKWGLANSRGKKYCGVRNEIDILYKAGCYADFTFPAWGLMNPRKKNALFYPSCKWHFGKPYTAGFDVTLGMPKDGFMLIEGPGSISGLPGSLSRYGLLRKIVSPISPGIDNYFVPTPARFDCWVRSGVCVKGRPEWIFIKVHTHGAREKNHEACFGRIIGEIYRYALQKYNNSTTYQMHFVTAREMFNIIKAAESGFHENPGLYRDHCIGRYKNSI